MTPPKLNRTLIFNQRSALGSAYSHNRSIVVKTITVANVATVGDDQRFGTRNSFFAPRLTRGGRFAHFFPVAIQSAFTKLRDMMVSIANRLGGWDELTDESYCCNYQGNEFLCTTGSWVFNVFLVRTGG